jgi:hypothetical protein
MPIVGDWDGDGDDTVGLFDPAAGKFYLRDSNSAGVGNTVFRYGPTNSGWKPVVGDWNEDGTDTIGLHDAAGGRFFLKDTNSGGAADMVFRFGPIGAAWMPLSGDWDGIFVSGAASAAASQSPGTYAAATTNLASTTGSTAGMTGNGATQQVGLLSSEVQPAVDSGTPTMTVNGLWAGAQSSLSSAVEDNDAVDSALAELIDEWALGGLSQPLL